MSSLLESFWKHPPAPPSLLFTQRPQPPPPPGLSLAPNSQVFEREPRCVR